MLKNMVVRDLYQTVIGTVCRVTGINENDMLNSNKEVGMPCLIKLLSFGK